MESGKVGIHSTQVALFRQGRDGRGTLQALADQGHDVDAAAAGAAPGEIGEYGDLLVGEVAGAQA